MNLFKTYKSDFRQNLWLAYPIMLGQIGQITVNIADNLMVGRLGSKSLAAVSIANSIFVVFIVIGMGIAFALPALISEADGAGKLRSISRFFKHSLVINMIFAVVSLIVILGVIPFLVYARQDPEVLQLAIPYLKVSAWTMLPIMLFLTLKSYCEGLSKTKFPMYAIIVGNVVNIFLNYLLIFGHWGMPELGVVGAVTASMIARIAMILVLTFFILKNAYLKRFMIAANFKVFQKRIFLRILDLGVPTSLQMFFEISAFSGAALIMGMVGEKAQAAHQISINLASITFLFCSGLALAATIRVGNQLGKQDFPKLRSAGISAIIQVIIFMSCTAFLFILFRNFLPTLYIRDMEVVGIAATLLIWAGIFQIPDGIQVAALGALRGVQDVKIPTILTCIAYWFFGIPASYYLALHTPLGPSGVWVGLLIGLSISATLLTRRFYRLTEKLV